MAGSELKPVRCGCGGYIEYVSLEDDWCYLKCVDCGIETDIYPSEDKAIQAWNKAMGAYGRTEYWEDDDE